MGEALNRFKRVPYIGRGLMFPWLIEKKMEAQKVRLQGPKFIICPSEAIRDLLIRNGVHPEKIFLIRYGIELIPRLPLGETDGRRIRFGYIGTLNRAKGFHILLQALEKITSQNYFELHIFGEAQNPWDKEFVSECMARYCGKAKIISHGYIPHDRLSDAFKEIDILILPSIYLEVFGLVIWEAFSAGRPVIVSKSGGPEEVVRDGVDGFVVERNNSNALAVAMQKFTDNPELMHRMAQQNPYVRTIQEHVDELENIYASLY
jgi:glycosyltransferase involved in cell wall biosynthesis